jgi:hypothetical protein
MVLPSFGGARESRNLLHGVRSPPVRGDPGVAQAPAGRNRLHDAVETMAGAFGAIGVCCYDEAAGLRWRGGGQGIGTRRVSGRSGGYYPVQVISHRRPSTQSDPRIGLTVEGCYLLSLHIAEVELATQSVRTQRGGWALRPEIMS